MNQSIGAWRLVTYDDSAAAHGISFFLARFAVCRFVLSAKIRSVIHIVRPSAALIAKGRVTVDVLPPGTATCITSRESSGPRLGEGVVDAPKSP